MKKILCFTLAFLLSFNAITCNVLAEDFSGSSTDYNIPSKDTLKELPIDAPQATEKFLKNVYFQPMTEFFNTLGIDIWGDNKVWSEDTSKFIVENAAKDNNVTTDGNYYYINANFIKNINQKVQDNIHALDGYYLIEPLYAPTYDNVKNVFKYSGFNWSSREVNSFNSIVSKYQTCFIERTTVDSSNFRLFGFATSNYAYIDNNSVFIRGSAGVDYVTFSSSYFYSSFSSTSVFGYSTSDLNPSEQDQRTDAICFGSPFKVFYSKTEYDNYVNKGRQYYAPQLPIANIRIPVTYINNINTKRNKRGQIIEKQTLLIIDECQTMFNSRSWNQRGRSEWVIFFTQHRKFGYTVILVSQHKDLIDKQIRHIFQHDYEHRNVKNFKLIGWFLALLLGGNFFAIPVKSMDTGKKDHTEFMLASRKYYKLYDSYKIFDTKTLKQL